MRRRSHPQHSGPLLQWRASAVLAPLRRGAFEAVRSTGVFRTKASEPLHMSRRSVRTTRPRENEGVPRVADEPLATDWIVGAYLHAVRPRLTEAPSTSGRDHALRRNAHSRTPNPCPPRRRASHGYSTAVPCSRVADPQFRYAEGRWQRSHHLVDERSARPAKAGWMLGAFLLLRRQMLDEAASTRASASMDRTSTGCYPAAKPGRKSSHIPQARVRHEHRALGAKKRGPKQPPPT